MGNQQPKEVLSQVTNSFLPGGGHSFDGKMGDSIMSMVGQEQQANGMSKMMPGGGM